MSYNERYGANDRHRRDGLLDIVGSVSVSIRPPCECIAKPLIGFNHKHLMACREGDQTPMFVECDACRLEYRAREHVDEASVWCEGLQTTVVGIGDDDTALAIDTETSRLVELARLISFVAKLEQERAVD